MSVGCTRNTADDAKTLVVGCQGGFPLWRYGRRRLWLGAPLVTVVAAVVLVTILSPGSAGSARDRRWQQDIAYLARELPKVHVNGLGSAKKSAWDAAAARLEAQVPRLSDGEPSTITRSRRFSADCGW
jgi:hypothetical protein